ncbi:indolepyruvate ferredoxin oxidoreductase subunit alpha, partial [bacterium (Candidatus Gribaldobacteria) CG_4_10_14_0_8_um_filter_33_9]
HIPILEPADSQECLDFIKLGFDISEKFGLPVIVRLTTRVAHQRSVVELGKFTPRADLGVVKFVPNKHQFVTMPPRVLEMHQELLDKIEKIREYAEKSEINKVQNKIESSKIGVIASGVGYLHAMEAMEMLGLDLPVLKLGFFYPLPEQKIKEFI